MPDFQFLFTMIDMIEQIPKQNDDNEKPLLNPDMKTHLSLAHLVGTLRRSMEEVNGISPKKTENESGANEDESLVADSTKDE